jgi:cyclopropane fatty-acyl-phospholipid synthase-like methyltransferase
MDVAVTFSPLPQQQQEQLLQQEELQVHLLATSAQQKDEFEKQRDDLGALMEEDYP